MPPRMFLHKYMTKFQDKKFVRFSHPVFLRVPGTRVRMLLQNSFTPPFGWLVREKIFGEWPSFAKIETL